MNIQINAREWALCVPYNKKGVDVAMQFLDILEELLETEEGEPEK